MHPPMLPRARRMPSNLREWWRTAEGGDSLDGRQDERVHVSEQDVCAHTYARTHTHHARARMHMHMHMHTSRAEVSMVSYQSTSTSDGCTRERAKARVRP